MIHARSFLAPTLLRSSLYISQKLPDSLNAGQFKVNPFRGEPFGCAQESPVEPRAD